MTARSTGATVPTRSSVSPLRSQRDLGGYDFELDAEHRYAAAGHYKIRVEYSNGVISELTR